MAQPTSIRLPDEVKRRLEDRATRTHQRPTSLAARLIDEGLRMAEYPGVVFHDSPAHGRVAALSGGPDVAEVVDVLTGLESRGEERVAEAADWLGTHPARVRLALSYYADHRAEIDAQIHQRRQEAEELRRRHDAERALLE